ncbi:MAG: CRISPR type III-associated RAMP protein Csm3 [bacterium]|nr:CRISPR type III-associated RAMP protein Csm3 [bacterium]
MRKLLGHRVLSGKLSCLTGVRIGGSKETQEVGGTDNPILRHPINHLPYIPGSSLKGKIRSLLEQKHRADRVMRDGKPCDCGECKVCIVFGCAAAKNTQSVTRSIFRDCVLTEESLARLETAREELGVPYSETKTEVLIDRRKGLSHSNIGPRVQERIPEGTEFKLEIVLREFEGDPVDDYVKFIKEGVALMENDTLGGSGTRGYGKVRVIWESKAPQEAH